MFIGFVDSREEYEAWLAAVSTTHRRRVSLRILTLEHKLVGTIAPELFVGGDVTIDVTRETTRIATLQVYDPSGRVARLRPDERMIQVVDERMVDGEWVETIVFTGPVAENPDTDGPVTQIVCHGKERLASGEFGRSRTWQRKKRATDVIRDMLRSTGETKLSQIPNLPHTIPAKVTVKRLDSPIKEARKLARAVNRDLFPDARGVWQLRRRPSKPTLLVTRQTLASQVRIDRPAGDGKNKWIVMGKKPEGDKKRVSASIALPRSSVLVPVRNGQRINRIDQTENAKLKNRKACLKVAKDRRDGALRQTTKQSFETLPFPHVEEHDLIKVVWPGGSVVARLEQVTIPLGDGTMSVGTLKRTTLPLGKPKGHRGGARDADRRRLGRGQGERTEAETHSHVSAVTKEIRGDQTVGTTATGANKIYVTNVDDFDEDGGRVRVAGTVYKYTEVDDGIDDNDQQVAQPSITISGIVSPDIPANARVNVYNPKTQDVVSEWVADLVDDVDGSTWQATVAPTLVRYLSSGISGLRGESVVIERDADDEWIVTRLIGKTPPTWLS